jgi:hypothetical protein
MTEHWERQDNDTDKSFEAFVAYRDMGADRSLAKVGEQLGKSTELIERWSSKDKWVARVNAWDIEQDRLWRESLATERRKMAERQARTAALAQSKIAAWIVNLDPDELSANEAARWLEVATKIEQAVLGLPQKVELSGPDGSALQVENMSAEETMARLRQVQSEIGEMIG